MSKIESKLFKRLLELQEEEQAILKQLSLTESKRIFKHQDKFYKITFRDNKLFLVQIK